MLCAVSSRVTLGGQCENLARAANSIGTGMLLSTFRDISTYLGGNLSQA